MCAVKILMGLPCPGCGFLHSLYSLATGDLAGMVEYYPSTPIILAALGYFLIAQRLGRKVTAGKRHFMERGVVAVILSQWVIRLIA